MFPIFLILLAIVIAVLVLAHRKPDAFRFERSISIQAPPEKIFPLINDLHRWPAWSPYEKRDPAMKKTYGGAELGVGATYEWLSDKVGAGRMEITGSVPPSSVTIQLDFTKPMVARNVVEFTLVPQGDSTLTTWSMHGPQPFMQKLMCLFMSMDTLLGKDFDSGLAAMKNVAESQ